MKKIIALLLVAVMCLSFVACGNNAEKENTGNNAETNNTQVSDKKAEAEKVILGSWKSNNGYIIIFNEDNIGYYKQGDNNRELRWKYDDEYNCYLFTLIGWSDCSFVLENKDGVDYIEIPGLGETFYRQDNNK